ncbi:sigma-54 interaction domain-containing protein [Sulfurirhabdus autotrophica]|uniref:Fis family sigma54 specific transcriptional regulator n=1 Tax=Sulfurirhabdus autotrophica TaxID=1706046 RepID=A0A4R3XXH6_9PROT|nr:sigma 54-interacting transcriptional regulator [Sulfurirhabdus autotrophica]TCV82323.1 Fis family sigma54 specific transcriptional regulator [Sulfurirhabdus autotrophica]
MADDKNITIELQSLIDVQENPFVLIDANYQIVAANQAYSMAYGLTPEQSVGRLCHEVSHHSDVPCHKNGEHCPHQQVFATGQPCQAVHVHFDQMNRPERVRLKGYPIRSADGTLYLGETVFPLDCSEGVDCEEMRMIGRSPAFLNCVDNLTSAAESEASVLLYGESGVGKELAAQYVHKRSSRNGKAFLAVDCAAITESLFESELFGHERGAFTGCIGRKQGLFELADRGTLFLDEIGEVPLAMQAKLLRVLETGEFRRVGGRELLKADVRIVSATNRNLLEMVDMGRFRLDLYYRISGIDINLPPLRERQSDIPALAETILSRNVGAGMRYRLTAEAITLLQAYSYPGNIRELRNILLKAAALSANGIIGPEHILLKEFNVVPKDKLLTDAVSYTREGEASPSMTQVEAQYIADLLVQHNGHRRTVADILGISERTLYRKLNLYQLS